MGLVQEPRMKRDWDWFRNQAMVQDTFIKVSQVVDGSMLLGEYILDRADRFMLLREEHVLPVADTRVLSVFRT